MVRFPSPPLFCLTPPLRGIHQNFWMKLSLQKVEEFYDLFTVKIAQS